MCTCLEALPATHAHADTTPDKLEAVLNDLGDRLQSWEVRGLLCRCSWRAELLECGHAHS